MEQKKNLTEMVFVLDRSGSMSGLEADTIGGFNSLIAKQKKEPGKAFVSTVLFDHEVKVIHDRVPLQKIKPMTDKEYYVRGCTALLDAMGETIKHISTIQKYARKEDRPDQTICVIITDGMENASERYSYEQIKHMVEYQQNKFGWTFLFLGANMDAVASARRVGIQKQHAVTYENDAEGTALNYQVLGVAMEQVRMGEDLAPEWKAPIEKDYKKRHR